MTNDKQPVTDKQHRMTPAPIQILGHGLAGALLAETLSGAGLCVRVWDDGGPSSSRVAAGLYTPLTGRRLIPSWRLEDALPAVNEFYPGLERLLGVPFFHPLPTLRIPRDASRRREWEERGDRRYARDIKPVNLPFEAPFGCLEIDGGGWVDLPAMLDALRARRVTRGEWGEPDGREGLTIWAQGARAATHPLWRELGWRNAHGDILTLHIPDLPEDRIYSFGNFLLPLGNQRFRLGATYHWERDDPAPDKTGRDKLEAELAEILRLPFRTITHQAGIRPVALARVPVAGPHPEYPEHWIFNGFGSKGVLYAPWMARQTLAALRDGGALPGDTRAARRIQRQRDRAKSRP